MYYIEGIVGVTLKVNMGHGETWKLHITVNREFSPNSFADAVSFLYTLNFRGMETSVEFETELDRRPTGQMCQPSFTWV